MKKNGFIFIETVIVLVMVALSLSLMLASYALVVRRNEINKYYNRPSEMYAVYYLFKLGSNSLNNYQDETTSFWVNSSNCNTYYGFSRTLGSSCGNVMQSFKIINAGIITNVATELSDTNYTKYDNATISFLNTLQVYKNEKNSETEEYNIPIRYAVAEFFFDNSYYFASVPLYDEVEEE